LIKKQAKAGLGTTTSQLEPDTRRKVIIRYMDGVLLRGYFNAEDESALQRNEAESFAVQTADGDRAEVHPADIKAIFFVKSFEGAPDYSEFKVFTFQPNGKGVWIRVHFRDGEIMEGVAPNRIDTYVKPVFFMTPPDPASNNQTVLVWKQSLVEMQILGLAAD